MSTVGLLGDPANRGNPAPRWSVVRGLPFASTARATLPALMAGLPGVPDRRAMVWVGPPLLASVPRSGLATPTRLPLTPLVRPLLPPVASRLFELTEATMPL